MYPRSGGIVSPSQTNGDIISKRADKHTFSTGINKLPAFWKNYCNLNCLIYLPRSRLVVADNHSVSLFTTLPPETDKEPPRCCLVLRFLTNRLVTLFAPFASWAKFSMRLGSLGQPLVAKAISSVSSVPLLNFFSSLALIVSQPSTCRRDRL